jgi:hypothetical protein
MLREKMVGICRKVSYLHLQIVILSRNITDNKGDTRVPADNGDLSLKDEDVRDKMKHTV